MQDLPDKIGLDEIPDVVRTILEGFPIIAGTAITVIGFLLKNLFNFYSDIKSRDSGHLAQVAREISCILNRGDSDFTALHSVPYLVFGHDHHATYEGISTKGGTLRNWYVNTGTWVQVYTGEERYRHEIEAHSVFLKIIPGPDTTGKGKAPDLLRWDHEKARPDRLKHLVE